VIDTSLIQPQLDVASLDESAGGLDIIADGILTSYLVGVAAAGGRKDMMITRLDASGDIESYAVLPEIRWEWGPGGEETGNSAFGAAYSYYGSGTPRLFFIANEGWGIFEMVTMARQPHLYLS
jgi:hypothetical protein